MEKVLMGNERDPQLSFKLNSGITVYTFFHKIYSTIFKYLPATQTLNK